MKFMHIAFAAVTLQSLTSNGARTVRKINVPQCLITFPLSGVVVLFILQDRVSRHRMAKATKEEDTTETVTETETTVPAITAKAAKETTVAATEVAVETTTTAEEEVTTTVAAKATKEPV